MFLFQDVTMPVWQIIGIIVVSSGILTFLLCRWADRQMYKMAMEDMDG